MSALLDGGHVRVGDGPRRQKYDNLLLDRWPHQGRSARREPRVTGDDETGAWSPVRSSRSCACRCPMWVKPSHNAGPAARTSCKALLGGDESFPFPKSGLRGRGRTAVLRRRQPERGRARLLRRFRDTTHAVTRLNQQDGGRRQSILITNNEVSERKPRALTA